MHAENAIQMEDISQIALKRYVSRSTHLKIHKRISWGINHVKGLYKAISSADLIQQINARKPQNIMMKVLEIVQSLCIPQLTSLGVADVASH